MKDRLATLSTLTYIAMAVVPLVVMIGIVLLMLRAHPGTPGASAPARTKAHSPPRPPMNGEPHGVNQLGYYAGEGVVGPAAPSPKMSNEQLAKYTDLLVQENERLKRERENRSAPAPDPLANEPYFL